MSGDTTMGRILLDRPIFLFTRRARLAAIVAGVLISACGGPTKPTIVDPPPTDPPSLSCPTVAPASSVNGTPVPVSYADPTILGGQTPFTLSCAPVSGSAYAVGTTQVTCTVTDARQRTAACTFPITVVIPKPPVLGATRFGAFGDSITYGEDGRALTVEGTIRPWRPADDRIGPWFQVTQNYPVVLEGLLKARYTTQSFTVDNLGRPGEAVTGTDPDTQARFSAAVARGYDAILIMEGANDLADRDASVEAAVVAGLRQMINTARSRGVRPYLATIPPQHHGCCPDRGLASSLVPGMNELIRNLASTENVTLVDVYDALLPNESAYIGFDGLHPTEAGYAKIAQTFFDAIKRTLEAAP